MIFEVTPQPTDQERAVIEAALAQEIRAEKEASAWADGLLPRRDDEPEA